MTAQQSLVLIKPDAFKRKLISMIFERFEKKGYEIIDMKYWDRAPRDLIEKHYEQDKEKSYFTANIDFMTSGPIISIIYQGENVIGGIRKMQGNRDTPGTIRGDFVTDFRENLVHASDSEESATKEIGIWFPSHSSKDETY